MKLQELKHNHSLTDLLKIILFSILMLLPFLSVATRCLYVICNKNAYESYYGETINEKQILQVDNLTQNSNYVINVPSNIEFIRQTSATDFTVTNVKLNGVDYNINTLRFYVNLNTTTLQIQGYNIPSNTDTFQVSTGSATTYTIEFTYINRNNDNYFTQILSITNKIEYNRYSYLDNVFDYSINQMAENPLFNWTQNTALYTGVKAMTNNLEIQTPVIAVLIVYWFILTIIYIIIDITLKLFTYLTHGIFHKS